MDALSPRESLWDTITPFHTGQWAKASQEAQRILAAHGLRLGAQIACGSFGCAHLLQEDPAQVVKITGDPSEAAAAAHLVEAFTEGEFAWEDTAIGQISCVYALSETQTFAILQERLHPLPPEAQRWIKDHRRDLLRVTERPFAQGDLLRQAQSVLGPAGSAQVDRLIRALALLRQLRIVWTDLHGGNVLQDDHGLWKIVDLGDSSVLDEDGWPVQQPLPQLRDSRHVPVEALRVPGKTRVLPPPLYTRGSILARGTQTKHCKKSKQGISPESAEFQRFVETVRRRLPGIGLGKKLGCGSWGCAYRAKERPGVVVKITGDRAEAAAAHRLLTAIQEKKVSWKDFPALARVYDVYGVLDDCEWPIPVFVILQEEVPEKAPSSLSGYLTYRVGTGAEDRVWHAIVNTAWGTARQVPVKLLDLAEDFDLPHDQVVALTATIRVLASIGVYWHDLHDENVRVDDKGDWKIIDLGFSQAPDATLSTLAQDREDD